MSYIATGRYIDSTNRNGTFEVEVPSTDRRHITKVVESRYIAKKVIVNSVVPSPSMLAQQHAERVRQLDEERRLKANTPSSNFASSVGPTHSHAHPPQQSNGGSFGLIQFILLAIVAMVFVGGGNSSKDIAPAAVSDTTEQSLRVPTRPSEYIAPNRMDLFYPTPAEQRMYQPEPAAEVAPPVIEAEPFDIRDRPRRGRER